MKNPLNYHLSSLKNFFEEHSKWIIRLILLLVPLAVYWQATGFEMVWDDTSYYFGYHPLLSEPNWKNFVENWTKLYVGEYTPIMTSFWGLLLIIGSQFPVPGQQFNSFVLHLANIVLHIANGFLVFSLLKSIVKNRWASLLGALVFLLHPIQVQSAAWVTGTRGTFSVFFGLLTIFFYIRSRDRDALTKKQFIINMSLCLFFFLIALLSKPTVMVIPFFIFFIELFGFGSSIKDTLKKTSPVLIMLFLWSAASLPIMIFAEKESLSYTIPLLQRPFFLADGINYYLYKIIYPASIAVSYARQAKDLIGTYKLFAGSIITLLLIFELWRSRKKHPVLVLSFVLFVLGMLPVSGLIPYSYYINWGIVTNRYIYLSMTGVSLACAYALTRSKKEWVWVLGVIIVFTLGMKTYLVQIPSWKNNFTLWDHCIKVTPEEARAYNFRGLEYIKRKEPAKALMDFNKAIEINPGLQEAYLNRAILYLKAGSNDLAMADFTLAININPDTAEIYYNRGTLYYNTGRKKLAMEDFSRAIKLNPYDVNSLKNRGILYAASGKYKEALEDYNRALKINPGEANVYFSRGNLFRMTNEHQKALLDYSRAIAVNPGMWEAYYNRGALYIMLKDKKKALEDINKVLEINPGNMKAYSIRDSLIGK